MKFTRPPVSSHWVQVGPPDKWSLTNLFHYRNDLGDRAPREQRAVQDRFHRTAINSHPTGPARGRRERRLRRHRRDTSK